MRKSLRGLIRRGAAPLRLGGNILLRAPLATAYSLFQRVRSFWQTGSRRELARIIADDADLAALMHSNRPVII